MEDHAVQFAVQFCDELAYSFGSTDAGGDYVLGSSSAIMPQCPSWAIHGILGGSDGMDCGYEILHYATDVIDELGQEDQVIIGTGGIAYDIEGVVVVVASPSSQTCACLRKEQRWRLS